MSYQDHLLHHQSHSSHLTVTIHQASKQRRNTAHRNPSQINMCIEVKYHYFCGVVVRTQRTRCPSYILFPNEGNHQVQLYDMCLARDEWAARKGQCYQQGCPQNEPSTLDAKLVKCPGCSTLLPQGQPLAELNVNDAKFLDRTL